METMSQSWTRTVSIRVLDSPGFTTNSLML